MSPVRGGGPRPPVILCFHAVSATWPSQLVIQPDVLRGQLHQFAERGFVGLTFAEAERRRAAGTLPERTVVVTFDDAYVSTLEAVPVLDEVGYPATVFAPTSFVDTGALLVWPGVDMWLGTPFERELTPLDWDALRGLAAHGWEIGSHTVTHALLPSVDDEALERELARSRERVVAEMGACETVAYPYGHADARVARAAERAGYLAGCTLGFSHTADGPFLRQRLGLAPPHRGRWLRVFASDAALAARRSPLADALTRLRGGHG